jgi:hypothetical protein
VGQICVGIKFYFRCPQFFCTFRAPSQKTAALCAVRSIFAIGRPAR